MQFAQERLTEALIQELMPLAQKHYREIARYQDIELKPDWAKYLFIDTQGSLAVFTYRDSNTQELHGYAFFIVAKNLHYSDSIQAAQDVIFIHPDHRGYGRLFIRYCDQRLTAMKVQVVTQHVKVYQNWGKLLERMGYEAVDVIYSKRLDKPVAGSVKLKAVQ